MDKAARITAVLLAVACMVAYSLVAQADDSLERAKKSGITLGLSNEPPYTYLGPDGKAAGANAEIVVAIFKRMGIADVRPVLTEFASLIPGLKAGRFDVATPMFILPSRCQEVAFANPLTKTDSAMLVKKGNPKNIHSYEDVAKNADVTLSVMAGTAEQGYARRAGVPDNRIVALQDPGAMLSAVAAGRADAVAATPGSVQSMAKKGGGDVEQAQPFTTPPWGIAYSSVPFRREDVSLREGFNRAAKDFVGSAEYMKINAQIGRGPEALPGNVMTDEVCKRE
jgi:polar amino acid transport system substrate-binding protein